MRVMVELDSGEVCLKLKSYEESIERGCQLESGRLGVVKCSEFLR